MKHDRGLEYGYGYKHAYKPSLLRNNTGKKSKLFIKKWIFLGSYCEHLLAQLLIYIYLAQITKCGLLILISCLLAFNRWKTITANKQMCKHIQTSPIVFKSTWEEARVCNLNHTRTQTHTHLNHLTGEYAVSFISVGAQTNPPGNSLTVLYTWDHNRDTQSWILKTLQPGWQ